MATALATVPDYSSEPYGTTTDTVRRMLQLASGKRGELSLKLRMTVEGIVRHVRPRDRLSQMAAIYDWFDAHFNYVNDPVEVELVKDPERILEEIEAYGVAVGDCDDASTFLYAAVRSVGIPSEFVRARFKPGSYTHVFAAGKDQWGRWIVLDPVAGMRTGQMISKLQGVTMGLGTFGEGDSLRGLGAVGLTAGLGGIAASIGWGKKNVGVGAGIGALAGLLLVFGTAHSRVN